MTAMAATGEPSERAPVQPGRPPGPGERQLGGIMAPTSPGRRPGRDEITVTAVGGRHLCFARKCRDLGKLADVIVIFGELGSGHGDALWKQVWNTSQAMCTDCLNLALAVITARRPHVVVHDSRTPAPGGAQRGG